MDVVCDDNTVETFKICEELKQDNIIKIIIHDGITTIPDYFGFKLPNLREVKMSDSVTMIRDHFLYGCKKLKKVSLSNNITHIGIEFLADCVSIENIELPETIEVIGRYFLHTCTSLKSLNFKSNINEIGPGFIFNCSSLQSCKIFGPIKNINNCPIYGGFRECTNLEEFILVSTEKLENIGYKNDIPEHAVIQSDCQKIDLKDLCHVKKILIKSKAIGDLTKNAIS